MKFFKCIKHAFSMALHSKLRSWLTIIGIVIGVSAVIAIVSIGEAMQSEINSRLSGLGGDILTLTAGYSRGGNMFGERGPGGASGNTATTKEPELTNLDVQALKGIADISMFDTNIRGNVKVSYLGKTGSVSITGVDESVWSKITTNTLKEGRFLDSADQNVIVIGGRLASTYFSQPLGINKMLNINGNAFRVVGILDDQSNGIYMPIQMAYQTIEDKTQGVFDTITIKVKDENSLNETMTKIEQKLMVVRHVTSAKKDFSISSSKQMQETRAEAMSSVNMFLLAIAGVSLIVGAVGVANTMFTSVLEKTKEIGIMKAVGAKNRDILLIFILNSALIGLTGGVIGIIIGGLLSSLIPAFLGDMPFLREGGIVSLNSVLLAVSVSVGVGIVAGIVPAYQASKLKPVDALRYE